MKAIVEFMAGDWDRDAVNGRYTVTYSDVTEIRPGIGRSDEMYIISRGGGTTLNNVIRIEVFP